MTDVGDKSGNVRLKKWIQFISTLAYSLGSNFYDVSRLGFIHFCELSHGRQWITHTNTHLNLDTSIGLKTVFQ